MSKKYNLNVVKLPFKNNEWVDADERIFLACFEILSKFVETELGKTNSKQNSYRGYNLDSDRDEEKTAIDLYIWYKHELSKLSDENNYKNCNNMHTRIENIKNDKLEQLIKIRFVLWT
ncbi:MAG: hypothetical protein [Caudoviricetes sp.]|nr:MAG: hypothetical protein [Caudoviricetes sp.]